MSDKPAVSTEADPYVDELERLENSSVEVHRWGSLIWLTIRSEQSVGKSIGLDTYEAHEVAAMLTRAATSHQRPVRDEPQA